MIQRKQSGIGKELEMLIVVVLGYRRMKLLWIMKMSVSVWWERISGRNGANIFKMNESTRVWRMWVMNGFFQFLLLYMGIK